MTDVTTGQRVRKIRAHREIVNTLDRTIAGSGTELLATGSDDGTVKIWEGGDEASKQAVATFEIGCPVTSVCWNKEGNAVYVGAIDNEVHVCLNSLTLFPLLIYLSTDIRSPQRRANIHAYRTHRYSHISGAVTQRCIPSLSLFFITNYRLGCASLCLQPLTYTPGSAGCPSRIRKHPPARRVE